jgi:hypothetical protein
LVDIRKEISYPQIQGVTGCQRSASPNKEGNPHRTVYGGAPDCPVRQATDDKNCLPGLLSTAPSCLGAIKGTPRRMMEYTKHSLSTLDPLQETPKFSWAGLFSSAGPRKYNVIFVGKSDRRNCVLFSWARENFRRQAHENTKGIFVGIGDRRNCVLFSSAAARPTKIRGVFSSAASRPTKISH